MRPAESQALGSLGTRSSRARSIPDRRPRAVYVPGGVNQELAGAIVGSLADRIVVVNGDGVIRTANPAWIDFAVSQSKTIAAPINVGANYFDFCRATLANGCREMAAIADGVRAVANGDAPYFQGEYVANENGAQTRCLVTATPLRTESVGAVVAHAPFRRGLNDRRIGDRGTSDVASKLVAAQETERSRIGRELHDDLGQRTALLAVKLEALSGNARISAARLRAGVADAERMLHELAVSIHELSHQLHPAKLRLLGLVATLEALCREISRESGARVSFSAHNVPAQVPEETALCVFRVTQEAVQNAVKHSGAEDIHVQLGFAGTHLNLRVSDTGSGFDLSASDRAGIGLVTMHERVELSGGSLKISAAKSTGTTVEATIPLPRINSDMPS